MDVRFFPSQMLSFSINMSEGKTLIKYDKIKKTVFWMEDSFTCDKHWNPNM